MVLTLPERIGKECQRCLLTERWRDVISSSCIQGLERCSVAMLFSNVERLATTSTGPRRQKESASKIQVPRPVVVKIYNKGIGGVELINQKAEAYNLDQKSSIRFYLCIFLDLMNVACANSNILYNMTHPNDLTLLHFKIIVSTYLIGRYTNRSRAPPDGKTGSKRKYQNQFEQVNLPPHLSVF